VRRELDRLSGTWALVAGEMEGVALPAEVLVRSTLVIEGIAYALTLDARTDAGILVLDPKGPAGTLVVFSTDGTELHGTYSLSGDGQQLKLRVAIPVVQRPDELKGGSGTQFLTFKRIQPQRGP
jgi:uncharacterized protein (TIGR03067 family)